MINTTTYSIKNLYLTKTVVASYIQRFWNEEYNIIVNDGIQKHLMILIKVHFTDESQGYRTLGHLRKVNLNDKDQFIDYIIERLTILNESYTSISINKITFTYIIKEGVATGTRTLLQNMDEKVSTTHRFNNMNLPLTMNPSEYGKILAQIAIEGFTRFIVTNNKVTFQIDVSLDNLINNVTLLGASNLNWIDTFVSDGCFKREIQKSTIYFLNGVEILRKQTLGAKPFRRLNIDKFCRNLSTFSLLKGK
jgi:hypothetical protein